MAPNTGVVVGIVLMMMGLPSAPNTGLVVGIVLMMGACNGAAGVVAGILTATTGDCDDGFAAEMKASFIPMS